MIFIVRRVEKRPLILNRFLVCHSRIIGQQSTLLCTHADVYDPYSAIQRVYVRFISLYWDGSRGLIYVFIVSHASLSIHVCVSTSAARSPPLHPHFCAPLLMPLRVLEYFSSFLILPFLLKLQFI